MRAAAVPHDPAPALDHDHNPVTNRRRSQDQEQDQDHEHEETRSAALLTSPPLRFKLDISAEPEAFSGRTRTTKPYEICFKNSGRIPDLRSPCSALSHCDRRRFKRSESHANHPRSE